MAFKTTCTYFFIKSAERLQGSLLIIINNILKHASVAKKQRRLANKQVYYLQYAFEYSVNTIAIKK